MKRICIVLLVMACVLGPTSAFAQGSFGHTVVDLSRDLSWRGDAGPWAVRPCPPVDTDLSKPDPGAPAAVAGHQRPLIADAAGRVGGSATSGGCTGDTRFPLAHNFVQSVGGVDQAIDNHRERRIAGRQQRSVDWAQARDRLRFA
jgi:hypothetical protein